MIKLFFQEEQERNQNLTNRYYKINDSAYAAMNNWDFKFQFQEHLLTDRSKYMNPSSSIKELLEDDD